MTEYHGFELVSERDIPELNTRAKLYRHTRTGAELLSMENDDDNKTFGITFKTPPPDSTGLPHILEHSVLCGSRKYPVKEPLIELVKGSLQTFINAMTMPDRTMYPIASTNLHDFYNMVDVYMDAVFFPAMDENTLHQEGWHYELNGKDAPMTLKGVVFNEMKGYYSSPDVMESEYMRHSLLPDTPYAHDYGGDPASIPDLTYEDFRTFHDTYYHPSNARIYFYGDDDPMERLRLVNEFISGFDHREIDTELPLQPRFNEPRRREFPIETGEGDNKGFVTVGWLLNDVRDSETTLALGILDYILVDSAASPLRKALLDSGLGEDLSGEGLSASMREVTFSTGLKGIAVKDAGTIEKLILDTLQELADNGIDRDMIEAALNSVEFSLRENNTGSAPRGLVMMFRALQTWTHGGDPMERLAFADALERIKERAARPGYFEGLIRQYLLDNPHRSTIILKPDDTVRQQREAAEQARIEAARAAMSEAGIAAVIEDTEALKARQATPDSPEALATIPRLTLADMDKETKITPVEILQMQGSKVLYHPQPTNGIAYVDVGFNLHTLPQRLLPYIGLLGEMLLEMGTETEDYVKLTQRIGRKTGGIGFSAMLSSSKDSDASTTWVFLRGKAMATQTGDLLDILRDVLLTVKMDNRERFRQIVLEEKADKESTFGFVGHVPANRRLRAHFREADWANEMMNGVSYLFFLRELVGRIDTDWGGVLADLEAVRQALVNRDNMVVNVTYEDHLWSGLQPQLDSFLTAIPVHPVTPVRWMPGTLPVNEGLTVPTQVNYVSKGANLYDLGYKLHGSHLAILRYLNTTYMWEKVRVQGGAYGGSCGFDHVSGTAVYLSWQDPNLLGTLENYDGAAAFLRDLEISSDELEKSIIGSIGQLDSYQLPDAKGFSSLARHLIGYTHEQRQQMRDEVLGTTAADFRKFAEALALVAANGQVVVTGSPDSINGANTARDNWLTVTKVL
ncbi:MAG: insulinase family protein [Anaerolineaceae bacterium]|nr:insulinase family protein [Anaerolineaceae bacterium]